MFVMFSITFFVFLKRMQTFNICVYVSFLDAHQREKRLLLDEVIQLKKEKDIMDRDAQRKDSQILQARSELDKSVSSLRNAETKMQMLQNQVRTTRHLTCLYNQIKN